MYVCVTEIKIRLERVINNSLARGLGLDTGSNFRKQCWIALRNSWL